MKSNSRVLKFLLFVFALNSVSSCSVIAVRQFSELYGEETVQDRVVPASQLASGSVDYWQEVKPILDRRCAVCHSCYDAPCQLKMTSAGGIDRGASTSVVYDSKRLLAADPTRLFIDAQSTAEWREKGFFPVLNERRQTPDVNLQASVLARMLELKDLHPLPVTPRLPDSFDFALDRAQHCPKAEEFDAFARKFPLWGMPYGLPGISKQESQVLRRWLEEGAKVAEPPQIATALQKSVLEWERVLNGKSLKERLVARYLYEHLFLGDLYFSELDNQTYFKLVRSRTAPGFPLEIIPSVRPTDDPGVEGFYYRLMLQQETPVAKTHMPYALNKQRMKRFRELFLAPQYEVKTLPSYQVEVATNPFKAFEQLPPKSRYQFMLDEAEYFVMGFIKGPVCRGQTALNVIDDQFWVFFIDPDNDLVANDSAFLSVQSKHLRLPGEAGSNASLIGNWNQYSKLQREFLQAKRKFLSQASDSGVLPSLEMLWNGAGKNTNAALTVFRHYDSATVVRGLVGEQPKTAWVMGYPLLERMHYLLVADFDVFGNLGHQALTRFYMDFLRVEAENNFLLFLPKSARETEHEYWYRGLGSGANEYTMSEENFNWTESGVDYSTNNPKQELFAKLRLRIGGAIAHKYSLESSAAERFAHLSALKGRGISFLAETSLVRVRGKRSDALYTLILNRAHLNIAVLYLENRRLAPEEDTLTIVPGVIGAYPNTFFVVDEGRLNEFTERIAALASEQDYNKLLDDFGIRRTDPDFWKHSDWFQDAHLGSQPLNGGLLDYSRLENR